MVLGRLSMVVVGHPPSEERSPTAPTPEAASRVMALHVQLAVSDDGSGISGGVAGGGAGAGGAAQGGGDAAGLGGPVRPAVAGGQDQPAVPDRVAGGGAGTGHTVQVGARPTALDTP